MTAARRLGLVPAVGIGVGSMLGAGVFVVWGPAAQAAGRWLLIAVALAAVVAALNAFSTAQLAAFHPVAGGTYTYASRELSPAWGFVAGVGFVVGKTASIAAMALAIGAYAWPERPLVVATAAVVAAWALNATGVQRTAIAATVIAAIVLAGLLALMIASLTAPEGEAARDGAVAAVGIGGAATAWDTLTGIAGAAALVFFAFAGYARLATLGEDVRDPVRTIPRAIAVAVAVVVAVYVGLAAVLSRRPGTEALADAHRPLALAAPQDSGWPVVLGFLAALATAGAMVALMAGIGRTAMAMAREGDLPRTLERTTRGGVPAVAEALAGGAAVALVWWGDLTFALSMSSAAVLVYYAVAHAAALRAARAGHTAGFVMPRWAAWSGLTACLALVAALDPRPTVAAVVVALALVAIRAAARARARRRAGRDGTQESGPPRRR